MALVHTYAYYAHTHNDTPQYTCTRHASTYTPSCSIAHLIICASSAHHLHIYPTKHGTSFRDFCPRGRARGTKALLASANERKGNLCVIPQPGASLRPRRKKGRAQADRMRCDSDEEWAHRGLAAAQHRVLVACDCDQRTRTDIIHMVMDK